MSSEKQITDNTSQITSRYYIMRIHWKVFIQTTLSIMIYEQIIYKRSFYV